MKSSPVIKLGMRSQGSREGEMPKSTRGRRPSPYRANIRVPGLFKMRRAGTASSAAMRRRQGAWRAAQPAIRNSTVNS